MRRFDRGVCAAAGKGRRFVLFVEGVPNADRPTWDAGESGSVVDATHWYDDLTLVTKRWLGFAAYDARRDRLVLGPGRVRRYFIEALRELKEWSARKMAGAPTLLGEFGLPFDLNGAEAYRGRRLPRPREGPVRLLRRRGRESPGLDYLELRVVQSPRGWRPLEYGGSLHILPRRP